MGITIAACSYDKGQGWPTTQSQNIHCGIAKFHIIYAHTPRHLNNLPCHKCHTLLTMKQEIDNGLKIIPKLQASHCQHIHRLLISPNPVSLVRLQVVCAPVARKC